MDHAVQTHIRDFIIKTFPHTKRYNLQDDTPLLGEIVDSLGVLSLVTYVEEQFDIVISDDDLTPENFQSVNQLAAFVESKKTRDNF